MNKIWSLVFSLAEGVWIDILLHDIDMCKMSVDNTRAEVGYFNTSVAVIHALSERYCGDHSGCPTFSIIYNHL